MGVGGMGNPPLVRTALFRHFKRSEISLRWIPEQNQMLRLRQLFFCQAKEGECQRSTPPQEPPIGRAASIRTLPAIPQAAVPRWQVQFECEAQPLCGCAKCQTVRDYGKRNWMVTVRCIATGLPSSDAG